MDIDAKALDGLTSQDGRNKTFLALAAQGRWESALEVARLVAPADATEQERRDWGARRGICREALRSPTTQEHAEHEATPER